MPLVIPVADGKPVTLPLGQVASIHQGLGPAQINHLNRETVVNVQANVQGRSLNEVTRDINARLATLEKRVAARLPDHSGRRSARPGGGVYPDLHRARARRWC